MSSTYVYSTSISVLTGPNITLIQSDCGSQIAVTLTSATTNGSGLLTMVFVSALNSSQISTLNAIIQNRVAPVISSTDNEFTNTAFDTSCVISDATDATKQFKYRLTGATTGTNTTFVGAQTINRSIILPDATTTMLGANTTQTITNKTITGSTNTVAATQLQTTGSDVIVNAGSQPAIGQLLTATTTTNAGWQYPITNTFYEASIISSQTITSTVYVLMSGMSISPQLGTYNCNFTSSLTCSASATVNVALVLGIGPSSLTSTSASLASNVVTVNFASQGVVTGGTGGVLSTTLVVSAVTSGTLSEGQTISGTGIATGTTITQIQLGSGGIGSYTMSVANSVANGTTITAGANGYLIGQSIIAAGFTPTALNGTYSITALTPTSLQYALVASNQSATVQGTISCAGYLNATAASSSSNVVTITFSTNPISAGFLANQTIVVIGSSIAAYNGTWTITSVTSTTIVYTSTSGGTQTAAFPFASVGFVVPGTARNSVVTTTAAASTSLNKNLTITTQMPMSIFWNSSTGTITCKGAVFNANKVI